MPHSAINGNHVGARAMSIAAGGVPPTRWPPVLMSSPIFTVLVLAKRNQSPQSGRQAARAAAAASRRQPERCAAAMAGSSHTRAGVFNLAISAVVF